MSIPCLSLVFALSVLAASTTAQTLPGTKALDATGDLAAQMVAGIDSYLMRETEESVKGRAAFWKRDTSSWDAYQKSIEPNRQRFRQMLGLVDERSPAAMHIDSWVGPNGKVESVVAKGRGFKVYAVRWPVMRGVQGEGLLLVPDREAKGDIIALPDCDWTPEQFAGIEPGIPMQSQFARRLAEAGFRVLVPVLIDRKDTYSGIPELNRFTNLPHREWIYRAAYEMGRTMIGYEVQKVLAAVDWFYATSKKPHSEANDVLPNPWTPPIGVAGYGEGGLIALYAAAVDRRIHGTLVSGYYGQRESLWSEPIYRNVFGLLQEFGDAEIAAMIAPNILIVEASGSPKIDGPPAPRQGRSGAASGKIVTQNPDLSRQEIRKAIDLCGHQPEKFDMHLAVSKYLTKDYGGNLGMWPQEVGQGPPGYSNALDVFAQRLGGQPSANPGTAPIRATTQRPYDPSARMQRQFQQICSHTQLLMRDSPFRRAEFWSNADSSSVAKWAETTKSYRDYFWEEVQGKLPAPTMPMNPRTRQIYDTPKVRGYEVMLDLYPDVFAYGILLVPKNIKAGERRPVVVCQHGLEGRPTDVADPAVDNPAYHTYAYRLAEKGYVTFAPQNPYIGQEKFRVLLRKAQPLKLTLFSFIVRQHERILDWLSEQPFVDPDRIGFYGLSYGGKTAMRVPAILEKYRFSICSADYNEWIWKNVSMRDPYSYLLTVEYDMVEWNLGNTFNYAEMSWLICPRPFMVERGHHDGVAPDEWVSYEFAKTRRRYDLLGIGDRTELEIFVGPHTINGVGTFAFVDKHLK